ncbi:MAG TPA: fused MFS/spermidine synthase [Planctomycetota bacterium]|nr:fused MFS/spermidine synthase [Planctomycetota bacterium]
MSNAVVAGSEDEALRGSAAKRAAWALYFVAVMTGFLLMGVQIGVAKILAPAFGTSTFVWGSIIAVFMGSFAAGMLIGGYLADKKPHFGTLAALVLISGVLMLLIPLVGPAICFAISNMGFNEVIGPLIAGTVLFFVPSSLVAVVVPYMIKLTTTSLAGVGGVTGKVNFLNTAANIAGTLAFTFIILPLLPVSQVLYIAGGLQILTAIVGMLIFKSAQK